MTTDVVEDVFAPAVFSELPTEQLAEAIQLLSATYSPLAFQSFATPPTQTEAVAVVVARTGEEFLLSIAVEEQEPHLITVFFLQPAPEAVTLESWEDFEEQLAALAPSISALAAEVGSDECTPLYAVNADERLALGSTFKLYVLGELARQVESGAVTWDDEVAIQEQWKSLPSGTLQDAPAGTLVTLERLAELMISISDNTATDHLIHHLGRESVEAVQAEMGHGAPEMNVPLLTTRELFALKLSLSDDAVSAYLAANPDERQALLDTTIAAAQVRVDGAGDWTSPRYIDELEWFASASDLCNAMAWLHAASQRHGLEPLRQVLSLNPGVPIDEQVWTWVGYKGGSEPGVLNLTWLLERADGRVFVLSAGLNDTSALLNETAAIQLMMAALDLLADMP